MFSLIIRIYGLFSTASSVIVSVIIAKIYNINIYETPDLWISYLLSLFLFSVKFLHHVHRYVLKRYYNIHKQNNFRVFFCCFLNLKFSKNLRKKKKSKCFSVIIINARVLAAVTIIIIIIHYLGCIILYDLHNKGDRTNIITGIIHNMRLTLKSLVKYYTFNFCTSP